MTENESWVTEVEGIAGGGVAPGGHKLWEAW